MVRVGSRFPGAPPGTCDEQCSARTGVRHIGKTSFFSNLVVPALRRELGESTRNFRIMVSISEGEMGKIRGISPKGKWQRTQVTGPPRICGASRRGRRGGGENTVAERWDSHKVPFQPFCCVHRNEVNRVRVEVSCWPVQSTFSVTGIVKPCE